MTSGVPIGSLVQATAGRDDNQLFIVIGIVDNEYVLIVNGKNRSLKKPKKKKLKHLRFLGFVDDNISNLITLKKLKDADIRKSIKSFN